MRAEFMIKNITDINELEEVLKLQTLVWERNTVPVPQLIAVIHNGGVVMAAFEKNSQTIIGFCYGFAGMDQERNPYIYSHMLAIHPDYRNLGIGKKLKLEQRKWALQYGYKEMKWTFDPLEIRNGYLNLCKLGGTVSTYIPEFYGLMTDKINKGIPSDRIVLDWDLTSARSKKAIEENCLPTEAQHGYPSLLDWSDSNGYPKPEKSYEIQNEEGYLLAIPTDIQKIKEVNTDLVKDWRIRIRQIMLSAFEKGYALVGVRQSDSLVHYYILEKR